MSFRLNKRLMEIIESPQQLLGVDLQGKEVFCGPWVAQVLQIAQDLRLQEEPNVQIYSEDSLQFLKFFLAACVAGKKPILLPNQQPETLLRYCEEFPLRLNDSHEFASPPQDLPSEDFIAQLRDLPLDLDEAPMLLFTSGTTGEPKQVEKKVLHFINEAEVLETLFNLPKNATMVATVSHQHVYGMLFRMWWPFLSGRKVVSKTLEFPEQFPELIKSIANLSLVTTPSFLKRLDAASAKDLKGLDFLFSSGGPLPLEASQNIGQWLSSFPFEVYGSTESGGVALRQGTAEGQPSWKLFPGVTGSSETPGRLSICSPFFSEQTLEMGDQVHWVTADEFYLLGRVDRILKIEETRVSLKEMEAYFCEHPWVESVFLLNSTEGRQEIWGVVELNSSGVIALEKNGRFRHRQVFRKHLQNRFSPVVLPRRFRYIQEWPYNSRGKLDLKHLQELFHV